MSRNPSYKVGSILTAHEMTEYALRHRMRNTWGIMDEQEIKQTVSYAGDYWRLELIDISDFPHVADPDYPNRSMKAYPLVHYFDRDTSGMPYRDVLDGRHRIAMARARGETKTLAWVAYEGEPPEKAG